MTSLIRSGSSARIFPASCRAAVPFMLASPLSPLAQPMLADTRYDFKTVNRPTRNRVPSALHDSQCGILGVTFCYTSPKTPLSKRIARTDRSDLDKCFFKTIYGNAPERETQWRRVAFPQIERT